VRGGAGILKERGGRNLSEGRSCSIANLSFGKRQEKKTIPIIGGGGGGKKRETKRKKKIPPYLGALWRRAEKVGAMEVL